MEKEVILSIYNIYNNNIILTYTDINFINHFRDYSQMNTNLQTLINFMILLEKQYIENCIYNMIQELPIYIDIEKNYYKSNKKLFIIYKKLYSIYNTDYMKELEKYEEKKIKYNYPDFLKVKRFINSNTYNLHFNSAIQFESTIIISDIMNKPPILTYYDSYLFEQIKNLNIDMYNVIII